MKVEMHHKNEDTYVCVYTHSLFISFKYILLYILLF